MKIRFHSEERPGVLLWLICSFSIITFPQAMLVDTIMVKLGAKDDMLTFACAAVFSYIITRWFYDLDHEVSEYIKKKYP
jgi:hypothetical protein